MGNGQLGNPTSDLQVEVSRFSETGRAEITMASLSAFRWLTSVTGLVLLSLLVGVGCLTIGANPLSLGAVLQILGTAFQAGGEASESVGSIILLQVRLPRIVLAFLVGGALAAVGVGLQALLRNPLAEPYVLGISSGAAFWRHAWHTFGCRRNGHGAFDSPGFGRFSAAFSPFWWSIESA